MRWPWWTLGFAFGFAISWLINRCHPDNPQRRRECLVAAILITAGTGGIIWSLGLLGMMMGR